MPTMYQKTWKDYKSPLRVVTTSLLKSRARLATKCEKAHNKYMESEKGRRESEAIIRQQAERIHELEEKVRRLEAEGCRTKTIMEDDPPIGTHGYGCRMVALAVEIAKVVGLRASERVLKVICDFLGWDQKVPDWTTIRLWLLRLGVATLRAPFERADDWIWMLDHSVQIGPEKTLAVLGVRASKLPPPGTPLKHEDMRLLDVRTDTGWNKEKMKAVYAELAEQYGPPRAVLSDGAAELREGICVLKTRRSDVISLQDFKHKAANIFKALFGKDERFQDFLSRLGRTRSAIQQTELAHLVPPSMKVKSRFMNLKPRLRWAQAMLWLLDHPEAESRRWMTNQRLEEKLGWLRAFAEDIAAWSECENVIETGVTFINEQGLSCGAAERLGELFSPIARCQPSRCMADRLVELVSDAESHLENEERLPMSTEILESSFGLFKQLEGQHAKSGFTSLIAAFGSLLQTATPDRVGQAFLSTSVADVKRWTKSNLGETLAIKRNATYGEFRKASGANISPASG